MRTFENGREVTVYDPHRETAEKRRALEIRQRWKMQLTSEKGKALDGNTRSYNSGSSVNTANWQPPSTTANAEVSQALEVTRNKARDLERNNPYIERYLEELGANIIGSEGMTLQMQIGSFDRATKKTRLDPTANDIVEDGWHTWSNDPLSCDAAGFRTLDELDMLILRTTARDGNCLVEILEDYQDSPWGFAINVMEADFIDHNWNVPQLPNGNRVIMGVEVNEYSRPVAYYLLNSPPGDMRSYGMFGSQWNPAGIRSGKRNRRVEARNVLHFFRQQRPGQTMGISWIAPIVDQIQMLFAYEEAELIAARAEACKGGFFYSDVVGIDGNIGERPNPQSGDIEAPLSPGEMRGLPYGVKYAAVNPTHPNGNYGDYRKGCLRGIAGGLGMSYNILAGDLEGVNYSSLRGGLLDERELYKIKQRLFINRVKRRIFSEWLRVGLYSGRIPLTRQGFDYYNKPHFEGRRWDWVDPLKDINAAILARKYGFSSMREELAKRGKYVLDVFRETHGDFTLAKENGLTFNEDMMLILAPEAVSPDPEDEAQQPEPQNEVTE